MWDFWVIFRDGSIAIKIGKQDARDGRWFKEHGTFKDLCWSDYRRYKQFEAKNIEEAGRREINTESAAISEYKGCPFDCLRFVPTA